MSQNSKQLHQLARDYVASLGSGSFDSIPYAENVELRAPLCPGGSAVPLIGRDNLKEQWWAPLPEMVSGVEVINSYVSENQSSVVVEFMLRIDSIPCTLRVMDRFTVSEEGRITSQENFLDPRDVTNPGWQNEQSAT
jgi:hypothetical protein